jgi:hypothetical protein
MTPRPAVALNLAQLVALLNQSKFSRRKASTVVPECMMAFAKIMAEWHTLFRTSDAALTFFRIWNSTKKLHQKKSVCQDRNGSRAARE